MYAHVVVVSLLIIAGCFSCFHTVVNEANWVWILKGIEKLSLNILSGIKDLGLVHQQQQGAPLQRTYVGNGVFVDK